MKTWVLGFFEIQICSVDILSGSIFAQPVEIISNPVQRLNGTDCLRKKNLTHWYTILHVCIIIDCIFSQVINDNMKFHFISSRMLIDIVSHFEINNKSNFIVSCQQNVGKWTSKKLSLFIFNNLKNLSEISKKLKDSEEERVCQKMSVKHWKMIAIKQLDI